MNKRNWYPVGLRATQTKLAGEVESASRLGILVVRLTDGSKISIQGGRNVRSGEKVTLVQDHEGGYVIA